MNMGQNHQVLRLESVIP